MKVLITGDSRGIGEAIALLFLEKGHTVVGIDRLEAGDSLTVYYKVKVKKDKAKVTALNNSVSVSGLDLNKQERHIRGGLATRRKYKGEE